MCVRRYLGFVLLVWFPGALHAQSATQVCRAPTLNGGYLVPQQVTYPHDTQLTYACDNGRKPAVEGWWATTTCLNGKWSHEPQCIDEDACLPPEIPNAKYTEDQSGWFKNGHTIRIKCDEGYEAKNWDVTAKCINGTWTSVPVCEKSIKACGEPPKIPHAVVIHREYQEVFGADTEVQYECRDGSTAEGGDSKKIIYCMAGNWTEGPTCNIGTGQGAGQDGSAKVETSGSSAGSGTQPEADDTKPGTGHGGATGGGRDDGHTTSTGSGTPAGGDTSGSGTQPAGGGTSGSGRQPAGGGSSTSGSRDRDSFIAVERCGAYPNVPNGDVMERDPMFVKYKCNAFYALVAPDTVRCHSNGSWSQLPFCKAAFCVLSPPHTYLILPGVEYIKEGEPRLFSCTRDNYSSRVDCIGGQLFVSQCCYNFYRQHYPQYCP